MRNLKKILALVLALVMSLSLMATASAAESTVAANDYKIASTVLQGLGVVRGDDGGIRESDSITRAEVATLAYRIHTADVKDDKADLYRDLAAFTDLAPVQAWALGYIGYAYNAEIVKGNGDGTFNPNGNITGYEVLAMALRAIGYGKNHEFEGAEWQINTAAWGRREGLLDGVSAADQTRLDQPASRGMVFQILLNAIQHEDVGMSYITTDLYAGLDDSMANRLDLEVDTGVVIANQWAALDADTPLGEGKVKVEVSDGTTRTLNWSADTKETGGEYAEGLKDIGKSRTIYIQKSKVLYLADTGDNVVMDNEGAEKTVNALKGSLTVNDTTKHYTNFNDPSRYYSDWRIEVRLWIAPSMFGDGTVKTTFNIARKTVENVLGTPTVQDNGVLYFEKVIPVNETLNTQLPVIKEIFRVADDTQNSLNIRGEVYVGTKSASDANDVSNTMSYNQFEETYIKSEKTTVSGADNGNWLQVVDNDADGVAEYVLLVNYDLDTIVEHKNDKFYYKGLNIDDYTPVEIEGYTQTVGDVVLYAKIDGKAYVHKADTDTATFKTVNYKEEYAIDTNDKKWEQSGIGNYTGLPGTLTNVDELTSYNMYLDDYGYVRAYDSKVNYALLTEVYPTWSQNTSWVVDRNLIAEAMLVGDTAVKEYNVTNSYYNATVNPFYTDNWWVYPGITTDYRFDGDTIWYNNRNWLRPATHMLGVANREGDSFWYGDFDRCLVWERYGLAARDENDNVIFQDWLNEENGWSTDHINLNSWTNVAKYTQTENGLNLYTAAEHNGTAAVTDYVRLNPAYINIDNTTPLFQVDDDYYNRNYTSAQSHYVRTVDSTVFFVVVANESGTKGIRQYTGYQNLPKLAWDENNIRAMYSVARNTNANTDGNPYWVADVVVIEMYEYDVYESVALIYSNDYKIQGDVKYVQALDSQKGPINIIPNNINVWNGSFNGSYGFYGLSNITVYDAENNIYRADVTRIVDNETATDFSGSYYNDNNEYNKHGIYYGQVRSIYAEDTYSDYLTIDVLDKNDIVIDTVDVRVASYGGAYAITDKSTYNNLTQLLLKADTVNNKLEEGDKIIWVENDATARTAGFIVDLTDADYDEYGRVSYRSWHDTPAFLDVTEADRISRAQYDTTGRYYIGDPNTYWTYEEIIGKYDRNVRTAAPQNGFVVSEYDLYEGTTISVDTLMKPTFSGIMDDGLWHIRYELEDNTTYTVVVKRNTNATLVLNSIYRDVTVTSGVPVAANDNDWSFVLPVHNTGVKVVGTIFAANTRMPWATTVIYGNNETVRPGDISFDGTVTPPTPGTLSDAEALALIEAAYTKAKADATAKNDTVALAKIEQAYTDAKKAVADEMAKGPENTTTDNVTQVGQDWADEIAKIEITDNTAEITEVTINARLFGSTQTDVETGEVSYYTFKAITVPAENGVFTLTKAQLDALEPNGFTAELTKVVAGDDYTVEANEAGDAWTITATKATITLEVDYVTSSFEGSASDGEDNKGEEVDKDHVDGSGSGSGSVTIKPAARQTLSNVEVGKNYEITVTPDEDSVITALQFLKCKEISREKVGDAWVCIVTILSEDYVVKFTAELKNPAEDITVKFTLTGAGRNKTWADYVAVTVNGEEYTDETKIPAGEKTYTIEVAEAKDLGADDVVSWTINGEEKDSLTLRKDTTVREVVIAVTVESLEDLKREAKADIDEAAEAALLKALTPEQKKDITEAQALRKSVIDQATKKATIESEVASFNKDVETILGSEVAVGSSKVTKSPSKKVDGTYYLAPDAPALTADEIMAIVNNNDLGMTFQLKGGATATSGTGFAVLDEGLNEYTATIKRVYKLTIDDNDPVYYETMSDKIPGIPVGIYFLVNGTKNYAASATDATKDQVFKSTAADGLVLDLTSCADIELETGVKVEVDTATTAVANPFGSGNANVTCEEGGTSKAIADDSYVRPNTEITVKDVTPGSTASSGEYYFELTVNDRVFAKNTKGEAAVAVMGEDYSFYADGSANPVKISFAGGVMANGKYFLKDPTNPTAVNVDLADGTYVAVNTTEDHVVASGIVGGNTAANTTVFTVKNGKMTYQTKGVTTTDHVNATTGTLTIVPAAEVAVPATGNFGSVTTAKLTGFGATIDSLALGNGSGAASIYVPKNSTLSITAAATGLGAVGVKTSAGTTRNDGVASGANKTFTIDIGDADKYELSKCTAIDEIDVIAASNPVLTVEEKAVAFANSGDALATGIKSIEATNWSGKTSAGLTMTTLDQVKESAPAGCDISVTLTFTADTGYFFNADTEITAAGDGLKNPGNPVISDDGSTLTVTIVFTVQAATN